jgi:hypothetical protein
VQQGSTELLARLQRLEGQAGGAAWEPRPIVYCRQSQEAPNPAKRRDEPCHMQNKQQPPPLALWRGQSCTSRSLQLLPIAMLIKHRRDPAHLKAPHGVPALAVHKLVPTGATGRSPSRCIRRQSIRARGQHSGSCRCRRITQFGIRLPVEFDTTKHTAVGCVDTP